MDNFNKVISFVLGLVVVLVFFSVVTGRLKLPGKLSSSFAKVSPTPTPISTITVSDNSSKTSETSLFGNNYKTQSGKTTSKPSSIPEAGIPTFFIPSLLASGLGGVFLRKAGKK